MATDYYSTLGISRDASQSDIKKAYRKLTKELHPDKHKGDKDVEKKFKEVNEAYEVLKDESKRKRYDQFGKAGVGGAGGGAGAGGFGGFDFSGFSQGGGFEGNMNDIFETFFGGGSGGRRRQSERGRDHEVQIEIDFTDAVKGAEKMFQIERLMKCSECDGTGAAKDSQVVNCKDCGGTGQQTRTAQSFFGTVQQTVVCGTCKGSGKIPEKPCSKCSGEGRRKDAEDITVSIPPGIHHGQTLRVSGKGDAGRQGHPAGDLYVHVMIRPDKRFQRDRDDIHSEATVSFADAALGTDITIETVQGPVKLKIPSGTQPGQTFRIKNKGMPVIGTSRLGDHFVTVRIEIPKKLSRKERSLLEEWRKLS